MLSRLAKLWLYIRAPVRTFMVFHPIRALKLFLAFLLGKALFGRRRSGTVSESKVVGAGAAAPQGGQAVAAPALEAAPSEPPVAAEAAALEATPEPDREEGVTG